MVRKEIDAEGMSLDSEKLQANLSEQVKGLHH